MRLVQIQVPLEHADRLRSLAASYSAVWSSLVRAERAEGEQTVLLSVSASNDRIGELVAAVIEQIPGSELVLVPRGVLPVEPPLDEVDRHVHQVTRRSTLELVLSSLQSLGSWRGMLLYALLSGVVAAYAVVFDAVYLLVAAMLIAPMGAPAIVSVVGISIGDLRMSGRGAARFTVSVAVLVLAAAAFGALAGLDQSTETMEQLTSISRWSALLAVVAGAAGAQSQIQSDRSSLVTGTATGFLVAAALSPTSAVLGLSVVIGRWDQASVMTFQLTLQFFAIATGGWLVLTVFGVRPGDPTVGRGTRRSRSVLIGGVSAAVVGLIALQSAAGASYAKADLSRRAVSIVREAVREVPGARLVTVSARFTGPVDLTRRTGPLLVTIAIAPGVGGPEPADEVEQRVAAAARAALAHRIEGIAPFVVVTPVRAGDR